jgi:hypothetical protein
MLTVTPAAAAAVTALLDSPQVPEEAELRLQRGIDETGGAAIGIAIVTEPDTGDARIPVGNERELLLEPEVAEMLEDQVLDAEINEENVAFLIRSQTVNGHPPEE